MNLFLQKNWINQRYNATTNLATKMLVAKALTKCQNYLNVRN